MVRIHAGQLFGPSASPKKRHAGSRDPNADMPSAFPSRLFPVVLCLLGAWPALAQRPTDAVNPLIGTAPLLDKEYLGDNPVPGEELYSGTVNPGAMVPDPNGYVCVGPVTGFDGAYHVRGSGYRFDDSTLMGFTHLNGEYSDVNKLLFMPTIGPIKTRPGNRADPAQGYRSAKDPAKEKATAGYYAVFLSTYGIQVELTATANCGFHRYTFPRSEQANVLIDLANCRPNAASATAAVVDQHTIEGSQTSGKETVYFRAEFSKDFSSAGTWKDHVVSPDSASASGSGLGAYATFHTTDQEAILVRVGTSTTSQADAAANLAREIPKMDFDATRQQAGDLWSALLNRVTVEGGSSADRTNFYTGIYRMAAGPKYSWFPADQFGGLIVARGTNWAAQRLAGVRGSWGGGYWGPGNVSSLVALYKMGFRDLDMTGLYERLHESALNGGATAGAAYRKYGYIPAGSGVNDYVNRSIGLSSDDRAMAELAGIVGKTEDRAFFLARSQSYKKLFNPSAGFFLPRNADGSWLLPCDPVEPHARPRKTSSGKATPGITCGSTPTTFPDSSNCSADLFRLGPSWTLSLRPSITRRSRCAISPEWSACTSTATSSTAKFRTFTTRSGNRGKPRRSCEKSSGSSTTPSPPACAAWMITATWKGGL